MVRARRAAVVAAGVCLLVIGLSVQPSGAEDAFMRVTGSVQGQIQGDQSAINGIANSLNQVQVFATSFSLTNPVGATPGQVTKASPGPVGVVKGFDRASPKLLRAAFTGESLTVEIVWWMSTSNGARQTTTVRLDGALITGIQAGAQLTGSNASALEEVSLTYQRITLTVPTITAQGVVTGSTSVCLDVVANKAC